MRSGRRKVTFTKIDPFARATRTKQGSRKKNQLGSFKPAGMAAFPTIPSTFSAPPTIRDSLVTATSAAQDETVQECLPLILSAEGAAQDPFDFNQHGVPRLDRQQHVEFLNDALGDFPAQFVAADASRPWMVYWGLTGLNLLGDDVSVYRSRLVLAYSLQPQ